jgi:hypothetical protein
VRDEGRGDAKGEGDGGGKGANVHANGRGRGGYSGMNNKVQRHTGPNGQRL